MTRATPLGNFLNFFSEMPTDVQLGQSPCVVHRPTPTSRPVLAPTQRTRHDAPPPITPRSLVRGGIPRPDHDPTSMGDLGLIWHLSPGQVIGGYSPVRVTVGPGPLLARFVMP